MNYNQARNFIYKNARPLDLARWKYLFAGGGKEHPVVQGILRYLSFGKDFDGHTWANTIASNNDAPHAPWWEHAPAAEPSYNPTACLIAFILKFANRESPLIDLTEFKALLLGKGFNWL